MSKKAYKQLVHSLYLQLFLGVGALFTQCVVVDSSNSMFYRSMGGAVLIVLAINSLIYASRLRAASTFAQS